MRKDFEMPEEGLEALLSAMKPVAMIALQCGTPRSQQENANEAWRRLGEKLGFDYMTVRPNGKATGSFQQRRSYVRDWRSNPECSVGAINQAEIAQNVGSEEHHDHHHH